MKYLSLVVFMGAILFTSNGLAHDGNDGWVTLKKFKLWTNTYGDHHIRVQPNDGIYNASRKCKDLDSYFLSQNLSEEVRKRIYSTLLSAIATSRSVRAFIDTNNCVKNRPAIMNLIIE